MSRSILPPASLFALSALSCAKEHDAPAPPAPSAASKPAPDLGPPQGPPVTAELTFAPAVPKATNRKG